MSLHEYDTVINGMATTLLLTANEAKNRGLTAATPAKTAAKTTKPQGKAASVPLNKAAVAPGGKAPGVVSSPASGDQGGTGDGSAA